MYKDKGFYLVKRKHNNEPTVAQYTHLPFGDWEIVGSDEPFYHEGSKGADKEAELVGKILIIGKEIENL